MDRAAPRHDNDRREREPPRYSRLSRALLADIEEGRFAIGASLPTEAELQARFRVSRHTVREALRELKEAGVVTSRAGIGTWVRALPRARRAVQTAQSVEDLLRFSEATRFVLIGTRDVGQDELPPEAKGGGLPRWLAVDLLRVVVGDERPLARLNVWIRPAYADIVPLIEGTASPIFKLIEAQHGDVPAEIRQEIEPVLLGAQDATQLDTPVGAPALRITRLYYDAQDRLMEAAVGLYPGDRYRQSSTLRLERRP